MTRDPGEAGSETVHAVRIGDARLVVETDGDGEAILWIHGFPLDRTVWRGVSGAMEGCRSIVPDLRGFGESEAPPHGYGMSRYADDLRALLDALNVASAVVCGLSMGGYVAFEVVRRDASRVHGLVLANTRPEPDTTEGKRGRDDMIAMVRRAGTEPLADLLVPKLLAPETVRERPEVVRRLRTMITRHPPVGIVGALEAMKERVDSRPLLPSIRVPTLVVAGASDPLVPVEHARALANAIPNARLAVIAHAGHLAPLEQPEATRKVIQEFLRTRE